MPGFEVIGQEEQDAVNEIFNLGKGVLFAHGFDARRDRFRVREFEKAFAKKFNVPYAQAVTSGTAALYVALKALGIRPGDEVITQAFTFVATVEAILMLDAVPVLTESDETYNMDPDDLAKKITKKTKAIIPVHMAGVPARMNEILAIAKTHHIPVLEDSAQAIGAKYNGKYMGTLGDLGAFSLDFGKTITTGEGGMILTSSESLFLDARAFHDHGHDYALGIGRADDTCRSWGFNFRMSELNAAVGLVQLEKLNHILDRSRAIKDYVVNVLKTENKAIKFREVPAEAEENADAIIFSYEKSEYTQQVLSRLAGVGIGTKNIPDALKWHFAEYWTHMPLQQRAWPVTKDLLSRTIALPVMVMWTDEFVEEYIAKLLVALKV